MELVSRSPTSDRNQKRCIGMNDVLHNLLIEILHRLPLKSAKQGMLVCKLWYSLMSSPYFAHRFLEINYSSALVLTFQDDDQVRSFFVPKENSIIRSELFSFSFLPFEQMKVANLVALCQDLVLCQVRCCRNVSDSVYYICNPLTQSWIRLPVNPPCPSHRIRHGLVFRGSGHNLQYAVLRIPCYTNNDLRNCLNVQIFTSDSAIWSEKKLDFGREICGLSYDSSRPCISYEGMLFWVATSPVLIGLDPFIDGGSCRLIDLPPGLPNAHFKVAVCNGNLRLFDTCFDCETEVFYIRVWDLKDYENCEWRLEHDISFAGLFRSEDTYLPVEDYYIFGLACDPKDGDIMYIHMDDIGDCTIVSCNMRKKTFDVICECDILTDLESKAGIFDDALVYELPWQPTSIHALPPQNRLHDV